VSSRGLLVTIATGASEEASTALQPERARPAAEARNGCLRMQPDVLGARRLSAPVILGDSPESGNGGLTAEAGRTNFCRMTRRATRRLAWAGALLLIGAAGGLSALAQTADDIAVIQARALDLVNATRQDHGLPPLALEDKLSSAAQAHADDMFARHYHAHTSPEGRTVVDRYADVGGNRWRLIAENIAHCSGCRPPRRAGVVTRLQAGWMNSPGHRENILRAGLTHFGFGMVVDEQRQLYAVQTFAGPGLPRGLDDGESTAALMAGDLARQALDRLNAAREAAGRPRVQLSEALMRTAQAILPDRALKEFRLNHRGLAEALPPSERRRWRSLSLLAADCGGCGDAPTAADVRYFAQEWLDDPSYRESLLDARTTHVGFVIAASGEGRKVALAVLGRAP
jgi:uncharacterized protein YkwD